MSGFGIVPRKGGNGDSSDGFVPDAAAPQVRANAPTAANVPPFTGAPLGQVVSWRLKGDPRLVVRNPPESPFAERYRRLRLRLEQGAPDASLPRQVTVITSAVPGEGKTTTAINLAFAYAEDRNCRTLLVDADLRRPSVARYITPEPKSGLSEVLAGEASLERAVIEITGSGLQILPAGASRTTPLEVLQADSLRDLIATLRGRFDRILIDTPPTVPFTDAAVLAAHADGVILVVRAGAATKPLIRRAEESLSGTHLLGVVLNDVEFTVVDRYYYRYDDYEPGRYARALEHEGGASES